LYRSGNLSLEKVAVWLYECAFLRQSVSLTFQTLARPTFSPAGGSYTTAQMVTINHQTVVSVHYTTDGSTPTASSTLYTGPIPVSASETLKAISVDTGWINSPATSAVFTITP
jgi:hypothetical protein